MIDEVKKILIEQMEEKASDIENEIQKKINKLMKDEKIKTFSEYQKERDSLETVEYKTLLKLIERYKKATDLKDLGLNLQDAINLLEVNQIPVILTEADKNYKNNLENYTSKSDFICVHKTNYAPVGSKIKSDKEAKATMEGEFDFEGETYKYEYKNERDTVHTCVNGEVGNHIMGNWEECKYAVLIPLDDIKNEQIGAALSVDLFTKGGIDLTANTWILCPKGESQQIKKDNPNVHIMEYEGENVTEYAQAFVAKLGYHTEIARDTFWKNRENEKKFYDILRAEKEIPDIQVLHKDTSFCKDEITKNVINIIVAKYNKINKEGFVKFAKDVSVVARVNEDKLHWIFSDLDLFFEKMEEVGLTIPESYQNIIRLRNEIENKVKLREKGNGDLLFTTEEKLTEEEMLTIKKINNTLKGLEESKLTEDEKTKKIDKLFKRIVNVASTSNMDSIKKLKENNFENMEKNFINALDWFEFEEQEQMFQNSHSYRGVENTYLSRVDDLIAHKQRFALTKGDDMKINIIYQRPYHSNNPCSSIEGKIYFRYQDEEGSIYQIRYNEKSSEPIMMKDSKILELKKGESIFDLIPDSPNKECFKKYYNKIRFYNQETILEENLSIDEHEKEEKNISVNQIGKKTMNSETLDKKQVENNIEQWRARGIEGEKSIND